MKHIYLSIVACFFMVGALTAQNQTLVLNYEKTTFGEGQPLPAGEKFFVSGAVSAEIGYVAIDFLPSKGYSKYKKAYYSSFWKRSRGNNTPQFTMPVNYKLREGKEYDVYVGYYKEVSQEERAQVKESLNQTMDSYIFQAFDVSRNRMKLRKSPKQVMHDLDEIMNSGLSLFKSRTAIEFPGFSDLVKQKFKEADKIKLGKGRFLNLKSDNEDATSRQAYRERTVNDLKAMISYEIDQYLNTEMYVLVDDLYINDYETEKVKNSFAVNVGYGAAIINANPDEFNYASAPYLGISVPLGKEGMASPLLSRTSISFGAFLKNVEDQNDVKLSGPIFKVPTYAGLGFRPIKFLRVHVGAVFLEEVATAGQVSGVQDRFEVRPFVGLSAELNISIGFAD